VAAHWVGLFFKTPLSDGCHAVPIWTGSRDDGYVLTRELLLPGA
jgi:hypothetical protein